MKKSYLLGVVCACSIAFTSSPALASTLVFNTDGKITGLNGLTVGQDVYNVSFVDGTCLSIDPDCMTEGNYDNNLFGRFEDELSAQTSFTYTVEDFAAYDSDKSDYLLIWTVSNFEGYPLPTVRGTIIASSTFSVSYFGQVQNIDPNANGDDIYPNPAYDNGGFAQYTLVPVPAAVWLFGSALAGLGWMRRKPAV